MVATHYSMTSEAFTSGIPRERLKSATWEQIVAYKGIRLAMIAKDLDRYDIRPLVRLNPAILAKMSPGAKSIDPELGEVGDTVLTTEWQSVRSDYAITLYYRVKEDATLGGPSMKMVVMDDGAGGKLAVSQATKGFPGLVEFRMPAEMKESE